MRLNMYLDIEMRKLRIMIMLIGLTNNYDYIIVLTKYSLPVTL
jgi:hypothetical protein